MTRNLGNRKSNPGRKRKGSSIVIAVQQACTRGLRGPRRISQRKKKWSDTADLAKNWETSGHVEELSKGINKTKVTKQIFGLHKTERKEITEDNTGNIHKHHWVKPPMQDRSMRF